MSGNNAFERIGTQKRGTPWALRLFVITLNFLFFYLIIETRFLIRATLFFAALTVLATLIYIAKNRKIRRIKDNPIDVGQLIRKYLKINRKFMLATILGLTLAALILSHYILVTHNFRGDVYNSKLGEDIIPSYEAILGFNQAQDYNTLHEQFEIAFNETVKEEGLEPYDTHLSYSIGFGFFTGVHQEYIRTGLLTEKLFDLFSSNPSFDSTISYSDELKLMIAPQWWRWEGVEIPEDNTIIIVDDFTGNNQTVKLDYIWQPTQDEFNSMNQRIDGIYRYLDNNLFIPAGYQLEFIKSLNLSRPVEEVKLLGIIDHESFSPYEISEILTKLENIISKMDTFARVESSNFVYSESPVYRNLRYFQQELNSLLFVIFLLSSPMLVIALFLVYFSVNLVEQRKSRLVAIMKIRGISQTQLTIILVAEALIAGLIATFLGMLGSIPWTIFDITQNEVSFSGNSDFSYPPNWIWKIPLMTLILAFDLNFFSIRSISSTSVEEGEEAEEKKEPFWRRWYLDVIMFGSSLIYWIIMHIIPIEEFLRQVLIFGLGPFMLAFFVLGTPLFISRYFADFIGLFSKFLWKREGGIVALATRNMRKNRFSASRLATLLMLGMMLSFTALAIPHSLETWNVEQAKYNTGSDIYIDGLDVSNQTLIDYLDIEEIEGYSEVGYFQGFTSRGNIRIMGVNTSTFADVVYWRDSYAKDSLKSLMNHLGQNKSLIEQNAKEFLSLQEGDDYIFSYEIFSAEQGPTTAQLKINISKSFKYFPTHVTYLNQWENYLDPIYLVMDLKDLNQSVSSVNFGIFVDVKNSYNQTAVVESLEKKYENVTGIQITGVEGQQQAFREDSFVKLIFSFGESLLIITAIASMIAVGYFAFITLAERRREIGVFRAVGMISDQIFILLIIEILVIVLTAILIGISSGVFLASNFFLLIQGASLGSYPPLVIRYPLLTSLLFVFVTLIATVIAAAVPARITSQKQTGSILRAE